jgi:hypothetical protein
MRWLLWGVVAVATFVVPSSRVIAQQVIQYELVPNPYLFLLREPAVWGDLKLTSKQQDALTALNAGVDGRLLALRNMPNDEADKLWAQLLAETESGTATILSRDQQLRVKQIMLRVRGIECVQNEQVAAGMKFSTKQRESIDQIIKDAREGAAALREQAQAGKPREPLEKELAKLRTDEQKDILAELTAKQREQLIVLLGRGFDVTKLGKVSFKAPELVAGGKWLNSQPLQIADLKGRVVALHFWTFG